MEVRSVKAKTDDILIAQKITFRALKDRPQKSIVRGRCERFSSQQKDRTQR